MKKLFSHFFLLIIFLLLQLASNAQYWEKPLPKGAGFHFETDSSTFYNILSQTSGGTTTFTITHITLLGDSIRSFTATDTNFAVSTSLIEQLSDSSFIVAGKTTTNHAYVSRIDFNGNMLWYDTLLIDDESHYNDIAMINNSEFFLVGATGEFMFSPYGLVVKFNINGTREWVNQAGYNHEHRQIERWTDSSYIMMSGWNWSYFEEIDTTGNITQLFTAGRWPTRGGFMNDNGSITYRGEYYFSLRSAAAAFRKTSDGAGTLDFDLDWETTPSTESYLNHHDYSLDSNDYIMVGNLHAFNGANNGSLGTFLNGFFVKMDTNGVTDYTKNYPGRLKWCREYSPGCYLIHMDNKLIMDCCGGNPVPTDTTDIAICQGDSALVYGTYQNSAGIYYDSLQNILSCDSFYYATVLTVNPTYSFSQNDTICQGDSMLIYGTYQNIAGVYYDSLQTIFGCDSIYTTTLIVNPSYYSNQNVSICEGDSALIFSNYQDTTGIYYDSLTTIIGCDSILSIMLTVNPLPTVSISNFNPDTLCSNGNPVILPNASPTGGTYSGNGVSGGNFDPSIAGIGNHGIIYTYTDSNSCINGDTTIVTVEVCTGLNESNKLYEVIIYPNPNSNGFTITKQAGVTEIIHLKLYDTSSKLIIEKSIPENKKEIEINLTNYNNGIYFLHLNMNGSEPIIKKIVKH